MIYNLKNFRLNRFSSRFKSTLENSRKSIEDLNLILTISTEHDYDYLKFQVMGVTKRAKVKILH